MEPQALTKFTGSNKLENRIKVKFSQEDKRVEAQVLSMPGKLRCEDLLIRSQRYQIMSRSYPELCYDKHNAEHTLFINGADSSKDGTPAYRKYDDAQEAEKVCIMYAILLEIFNGGSKAQNNWCVRVSCEHKGEGAEANDALWVTFTIRQKTLEFHIEYLPSWLYLKYQTDCGKTAKPKKGDGFALSDGTYLITVGKTIHKDEIYRICLSNTKSSFFGTNGMVIQTINDPELRKASMTFASTKEAVQKMLCFIELIKQINRAGVGEDATHTIEVF